MEKSLQLVGLNEPALVIQGLDNDLRIEIDADAEIYPASMIKLPIAFATAVALESSAIDAGNILIEERFMTANDAPSPFVPGYSASLWELIDAMLSFSDNVATNALIDRIGRVRASTICEAAGLRQTAIRRFLSGSLPRIADPDSTGENTHTAHDAALLLTRIARGEVPYAQRLFSALEQQYWNTKLSAGLEAGDTFAHKTGDTSETSHDGGILTTAAGQRYVIVLYSRSPSTQETDQAFAHNMQEIRSTILRDR